MQTHAGIRDSGLGICRRRERCSRLEKPTHQRTDLPSYQLTNQHPTHLWLFFTPIPSSSLIVSGNGEMRWTGPFAMSTVVWPARLTIFGSAPFEMRYRIISLSPRAAAL